MIDFHDPVFIVVFSAVLAVVAFMYASVGHGGASGYLAMMALVGVPLMVMKPTALILNIFCCGDFLYFLSSGSAFPLEIILSLCDYFHSCGICRWHDHNQFHSL